MAVEEKVIFAPISATRARDKTAGFDKKSDRNGTEGTDRTVSATAGQASIYVRALLLLLKRVFT
jgi:hypothetical protein